MRRHAISRLTLLVLGLCGAAFPVSASAASSIDVALSAAVTEGQVTSLTYSGVLEDAYGGNAVASLRSFAQPGAVECAPSVDEMRARVAAELVHAIDVDAYGPYSKTGEHIFEVAGTYTLCLYLQDFGAPGDNVVARGSRSVSVASAGPSAGCLDARDALARARRVARQRQRAYQRRPTAARKRGMTRANAQVRAARQRVSSNCS